MTFHRGPAAAWAKLPANIRGAGFVAVGGFLLIIMAALVKQLGQSLPAFEVLFVRFLAGLIVLLRAGLAPGIEDCLYAENTPACDARFRRVHRQYVLLFCADSHSARRHCQHPVFSPADHDRDCRPVSRRARRPEAEYHHFGRLRRHLDDHQALRRRLRSVGIVGAGRCVFRHLGGAHRETAEPHRTDGHDHVLFRRLHHAICVYPGHADLADPNLAGIVAVDPHRRGRHHRPGIVYPRGSAWGRPASSCRSTICGSCTHSCSA